MAKTLHTTKLVGVYTSDGKAVPATTNEAHRVEFFDAPGCRVRIIPKTGDLELRTKHGKYYLKKHATKNYYHATCNATKVQISLKQIVGELRAWY